MEQVKKFTFGKDFGKSSAKKKLEILDSKPADLKDAEGLQAEVQEVFAIADIEKAEAAGFEKGKAAGLAEGKTLFYDQGVAEGNRKAQEEIKSSIETEVLKAVGKAQSSLAAHIKERELQHRDLKYASVEIAIAVIKKIFPLYEKSFGYDELKHQIDKVLIQLADEDAVTMEVSASLSKEQQQHLQDMFAVEGLAGKVQMHQRQDLQLSDVVLKWQGGRLERKVSDILSAVEKLIPRE